MMIVDSKSIKANDVPAIDSYDLTLITITAINMKYQDLLNKFEQ
ncbi:hypothetical protein [Dictyobacter kobayashii]|nr:hypothetical protein [Dictyobacter kobayashii]